MLYKEDIEHALYLRAFVFKVYDMTFVKTVDNGGVRDPKISITGRPRKDQEEEKKVTRRSLRQQEFFTVARKVKPHVTKALMTMVRLLDDPNSSEATKLKAADAVLSHYKSLVKEAFVDENDRELQELDNGGEAPEAIQPKESSAFTLHYIAPKTEATKDNNE